MASPEHGDERRPVPGRPLPDGDAFYTPGAGPFRAAVERRSAVPLVWLHRQPRWMLPLALGALFIAGLMAPGLLGALCLLVVTVFFSWLAFLTWPTLAPQQRVPRVIMVVVVLVLTVARFLGF
ncbi:hypothetical protein DFP74_5838 [Nocardiopsis sp. Huas11]|uniref:DUF6703 family protein n=1 Tax=Nocardiopsis sp. Huas11 TaxID=2183912 RepID=UPI000EB0BE75|nr:DUF6703 family protein [Nocardiopsis sp. Huas11]RKS10086.1 hypothetical protein DFP74_5838 [Nocardiopsis sp. Huas11]